MFTQIYSPTLSQEKYFTLTLFYSRGSDHIECEKTITNTFNKKNKGHFSCDDLLEFDDQALFFFIKERKEGNKLDYQCISVCHDSSSSPSPPCPLAGLLALLAGAGLLLQASHTSS